MRFSPALLLAAAGLASAHNKVTHFHVNGAAETKCVRQAASTDPISDLTSPDMACNAVSGSTAEKCEVAAGDEVAFEYRAEPDKAPEEVALKEGSIKVGVTDDSHKGPCAVYAKKVDDAASAEGAGDGWFKLEHDGVEDGEFCTTRLNNADAPLKATIPKSLAPGDYLLRAEILTLNNAAPDGEREPQFYPGCVQVTISGGDSSAKPDTVSIPGYLTVDSPGLLYNIWTTTDYSDYEIPGPAPLSEAAPAPAQPATPEEPETPEEPVTSKAPSVTVAPPIKPSTYPLHTESPTTTFETPIFTDIASSLPSELPEVELPDVELPVMPTEVPDVIVSSIVDIPTTLETIVTKIVTETGGYYPTASGSGGAGGDFPLPEPTGTGGYPFYPPTKPTGRPWGGRWRKYRYGGGDEKKKGTYGY